jgi:soluble lytic murein transglycosylase-like protein
MQDLRGTYVHRGDTELLRRRVRQWVMGSGAMLVVLAAGRMPIVGVARAEALGARPVVPVVVPAVEATAVTPEDRTRAANLATQATSRLQRWNRIYTLSRRWLVDTELARAIHDAALEAGLDPEFAFRLVNVESQFKDRATSSVGAIGLAQVMLPTARYFDRTITREKLYDRKTNLRIGFKYMRALIDENKGNVKLALLTYNRGIVAVQNELSLGLDPSNGYDRKVMRGYRGSARVQKQTTSMD